MMNTIDQRLMLDPRVLALNRFNERHFDKKSKTIVFDLWDTILCSENGDYTYARIEKISTDEIVKAIQSLVTKLLNQRHSKTNPFPYEPNEICIKTSTPIEEQVHRESMLKLHKQRPYLGADRVKISSVDYTKGLEASINILDLVITGEMITGERHDGPLRSRHINRLRSALTESNGGLYVISSRDSTFRLLEKNPTKFRPLKKVFDDGETKGLFCSHMCLLDPLEDWECVSDQMTLSDAPVQEGDSDIDIDLEDGGCMLPPMIDIPNA